MLSSLDKAVPNLLLVVVRCYKTSLGISWKLKFFPLGKCLYKDNFLIVIVGLLDLGYIYWPG